MALTSFVLTGCGSEEKEEVIETTVDEVVDEIVPEEIEPEKPKKDGHASVTIDDIEVMTKDLDEMNWAAAKEACEALGEGWRLPTKDELNILFENKEMIGGFAERFYWSSTDGDDDNTDAWVQEFKGRGFQNDGGKHYKYPSRPVRSMD